jgi:hypothetical protein
MNKLLLLFSLALLPFISEAQNHPACDSLVIQCCTFDTVGTDTLTILVTNYSNTYFFDYPGFLLMNATMDTVYAAETVNYFGIGPTPQPHYLESIQPINLPFAGYLQLYTSFYDTLRCTFPFFIADTVSTGISKTSYNASMTIYPNPSSGELNLNWSGDASAGPAFISIHNLLGEEIYHSSYTPQLLLKINAGIYFVRVYDEIDKLIALQKLLIE